MIRVLRWLLIVLGVAAVGIALSILVLGAQATASTAEGLYDALTGWRGPGTGPWPATMDSELRFYAALWGAYGLAMIHAAQRLPERLSRVPWLSAAFFVGGIGRAISLATVGAPHPFFELLMAIELGLPPVLVLLWWRARTSAQPA